jgi:hypothetical protein
VSICSRLGVTVYPLADPSCKQEQQEWQCYPTHATKMDRETGCKFRNGMKEYSSDHVARKQRYNSVRDATRDLMMTRTQGDPSAESELHRCCDH